MFPTTPLTVKVTPHHKPMCLVLRWKTPRTCTGPVLDDASFGGTVSGCWAHLAARRKGQSKPNKSGGPKDNIL